MENAKKPLAFSLAFATHPSLSGQLLGSQQPDLFQCGTGQSMILGGRSAKLMQVIVPVLCNMVEVRSRPKAGNC